MLTQISKREVVKERGQAHLPDLRDFLSERFMHASRAFQTREAVDQIISTHSNQLMVRKAGLPPLLLEVHSGLSGSAMTHCECTQFLIVRRHLDKLGYDVRQHLQRMINFLFGIVTAQRESNGTLRRRVRHIHGAQRG